MTRCEHIENPNATKWAEPGFVVTMCGIEVDGTRIAPGLIDATCKNCLRTIARLRRNVAANSYALGLGPKPGPPQAPDYGKDRRHA